MKFKPLAVVDPQEVGAFARRLARIEAAIERLEQQRRSARLSPADQRVLGQLLPAIAAEFGSDIFATREVLAHASPGLQLVREGLSPKRLGRLLRRAVDHPIEGYVVVRAGNENGAGLWSVQGFLGE